MDSNAPIIKNVLRRCYVVARWTKSSLLTVVDQISFLEIVALTCRTFICRNFICRPFETCSSSASDISTHRVVFKLVCKWEIKKHSKLILCTYINLNTPSNIIGRNIKIVIIENISDTGILTRATWARARYPNHYPRPCRIC